MSNTYKNIQQLNQAASHLLQIADPYHQSESWIDDKLVDMVNSLRDIRSFLEYETTQGNYNNPTIDITNTIRSATTMNKFIFADFKDFQKNLSKYLEKAKQEQDKEKALKDSQPKERKEKAPKDTSNYKRVEDPSVARGYRFELKSKDDYIEDKEDLRLKRERKDGEEYLLYLPGKTKEEQIKERDDKQKKKDSFEYAKAGKKILVEGRDDDEIASLRDMLLAIANQPNEKKNLKIQREINFAKSILGEDESGTLWLSKESGILRTIVRIASTDQVKYDIIVKALADMDDKGLQHTPKYEQAKKALEKLEKRMNESVTTEEESKSASDEPKLFTTTPKKEVDKSKNPRLTRTLEDYSPEELAQIEMIENRITEEGEQLPDDEFKPSASYLGWKRMSPKGEIIYVLSNKQIGAIGYLYENVQMRAQGLDPAKVRHKERGLDEDSEQKEKKKEKSLLEKQLEKIKSKKQEQKQQSLFAPEEEVNLGDVDLSIFDKKTSNLKSLLTRIKQAQTFLKNVR
jgi:hypothetical protein